MSDPKSNKNETPLESRLKRLIASAGPISLATYMTHCLTDPDHGYYTSRTSIGAKGDFITAPEVSQLFGELIGIWLLAVWRQAGRPTPFHLVEIGPGRGTLMRDMVRAIASAPEASQALHIHLVDISTSLKNQQALALSDTTAPIDWHETIQSLPNAPLFIVANEFFDCLPIHQWVMHSGKWYERVIGLDQDGQLAFGLGPVRALTTPLANPHTNQLADPTISNTIPEGAIWEQSPAAEAIMSDLAQTLTLQGGAGLFIDYGYTDFEYGDTFQAMRHHAFADPLALPGEQDLTAHVNFAALASTALHETQNNANNNHALTVPEPVDQGTFLLALGLLERAGQLGAGKSLAAQESLRDAVERLAAPNQMGNLFKILAIVPADSQIPPFSNS
ncbi:class I SAM-dependent methyltransferase [Cohaesibacter celericrescens]|uniref:class I SAM-dependent methyltransferase n=1 Tax=Cohaesibacter celericrescens TaxID=2067669 RepID=UPI0035628FFD